MSNILVITQLPKRTKKCDSVEDEKERFVSFAEKKYSDQEWKH